jgi:hypothetical protein
VNRGVRRCPKGMDEGGAVELTKGGEEAVAAQNTARGGGCSATGVDERPREGGAHGILKGDWRDKKRGVAASGGTLLNGMAGVDEGGGGGVDVRVEEREGRRGGPGAVAGGSGRPAIAPGRRAWVVPCHADRGAWGADRWATATVLDGDGWF